MSAPGRDPGKAIWGVQSTSRSRTRADSLTEQAARLCRHPGGGRTSPCTRTQQRHLQHGNTCLALWALTVRRQETSNLQELLQGAESKCELYSKAGKCCGCAGREQSARSQRHGNQPHGLLFGRKLNHCALLPQKTGPCHQCAFVGTSAKRLLHSSNKSHCREQEEATLALSDLT